MKDCTDHPALQPTTCAVGSAPPVAPVEDDATSVCHRPIARMPAVPSRRDADWERWLSQQLLQFKGDTDTGVDGNLAQGQRAAAI